MGREKNYWLLKTEPGEWSWDDQAANGGLSKWDGVKNKQAQKHMKGMGVGDLCFFYHSEIRNPPRWQPRLSVLPVEKDVWDKVREMGGGYEGNDGEEENDDSV
ncbi:UNVERIFIED_CONTAM: hypothetical protein Slati_3274000 [Sesamum latifolium]|uniref:EVE domain-containing protein n=1 Tax=Sesamum latifolium TaxID=2727402 RepID=A0AAW2UZL4_9LAMI